MTATFCSEILSGKKLLLKLSEVQWVENVPNWPDFSSKNLWIKVTNNPSIAKYFPDYPESKLP